MLNRKLMPRKNRSCQDHIPLTVEEIDKVISDWSDIKARLKELEEKDETYRRVMLNVFKTTGSDIIKGKNFQVIQRTYNKRTISRNLVPVDIFDRYAQTKEIQYVTLRRL